MTETRANQSRTASSKEQTRSNDERKKTWTPPDILGAPEPRDGYQHRWVRKDLLGKDEAQNVIKRARQHYEPVRADAHPDYLSVAAEDGKHDGIIMNGDLMLMEVPIDVPTNVEHIMTIKPTVFNGLLILNSKVRTML